MPKFDVVKFVSGPLDGVCWPCVLNPDKVCVQTKDGRLYVYETDLETEYGDGTKEYRMAPAVDPGESAGELALALLDEERRLGGPPAPGVEGLGIVDLDTE